MHKYTLSQKKFIEGLELALTLMIADGLIEEAKKHEPLMTWLHKGDPIMAVIEGELIGVDARVLNDVRRVFDVRF